MINYLNYIVKLSENSYYLFQLQKILFQPRIQKKGGISPPQKNFIHFSSMSSTNSS